MRTENRAIRPVAGFTRQVNPQDAATSLTDLSPLKSIGLHKLKGDRKKQWAMAINGPWRVCFRFHDGDAYDVEITDYH